MSPRSRALVLLASIAVVLVALRLASTERRESRTASRAAEARQSPSGERAPEPLPIRPLRFEEWPAALPGPPPVTIRVQDESGRPIPNTGLHLEYRWGQFVHQANTRAPGSASGAGRVTTNDRGEIDLVDAPSVVFSLVGDAASLTGIVELDPLHFGRAPPPPLIMRPDRPVEVSVRDSHGTPVPGIGVEALGAMCVSPARAWTDEDGVARFRVTCLDRALYEGPSIAVNVDGGFLATKSTPPVPWAVAGPTRIMAEIDPRVIARVRVLDDPATDPPAGQRTLSWAPAEDRSFGIQRGTRRFTGSTTAVALFFSGAVTFRLEEPGRRPSETTVTIAGEGPREVLIPRGAAPAIVRLRVVEGGLEAVARGRVQVSRAVAGVVAGPPEDVSALFSGGDSPVPTVIHLYERMPADEFLVEGETDDSGILPVEVDPDRTGMLRVQRTDLGPWTFVTGTLVAHPAIVGGQSLDVTASLPATPVIASGVVVDQSGAPIVGAWVTLAPSALRQSRPYVNRVTGPDGGFVFRSEHPAETMAVRASHPFLGRSDRVEVSGAHPHITLSLIPFGALVGRAVNVSPLPELPITLKVEPASGDDDRTWPPSPAFRSVLLPRDGGFTVAGLPPDIYILRFLIDDVVAATIEGVVVAPGADTADPRVAAVAVGDDLRTVAVVVRNPEGLPIERAGVTVFEEGRPPNPPGPFPRLTGPDGSATFLVSKQAQPFVRITCGDFVSARRRCTGSQLDVVLSRRIRLTVAIASSEPLPTTATWDRYTVVLRRMDDPDPATSGLSFEHRWYFRPSSPSFVIPSVEPGRFSVSIAPCRFVVSGIGGDMLTVGWIPLGEISVPPDQPPAPLRFEVDQAQCRFLLGLR